MLMQDSFLFAHNTILIILPRGTSMLDVIPFSPTLSFYGNYNINFYYLTNHSGKGSRNEYQQFIIVLSPKMYVTLSLIILISPYNYHCSE